MAHTVDRALLDWLDEPRSGSAIFFSDGGEGWREHSFEELAWSVREAAAHLHATRRDAGTRVALVLPTGPEFVAAFYGCLWNGETPCPLAPPMPLQRPEDYMTHAVRVLRLARPALVVTNRELAPLVAQAMVGAGLRDAPYVLGLRGERISPARRAPAELALLQFTSGSTGRPRGARVTWENLEENIRMIRRWMGYGEGDALATWLPLFHDMGLIGAVLTPTGSQNSIWIMRPEEFIRSPQRWLDCFGDGRATISVGPSFGFGYTLKRIVPEALAGLDFSGWRVALVGAERLDAAALGGFAQLLQPYGFRPEAYLPAYGLAEATLAVTGGVVGELASLVRLDWSTLRFGATVVVKQRAALDSDVNERLDEEAGWLVGCGRALPGLQLQIVDDEGVPLADGHLGEITLAGGTVVDGYEGGEGVSSTFADGILHTADAGFVLDGELFVLGRMADSLKVHGRSVYVEDLDGKLAALPGLARGRCVVLAGHGQDGPRLVAVAEADAGAWISDAADLLARAGGHEVTVQVRHGPRGTIQRTSSGKPRRRAMWQALMNGTLDAEVAVEVLANKARGPAR